MCLTKELNGMSLVCTNFYLLIISYNKLITIEIFTGIDNWARTTDHWFCKVWTTFTTSYWFPGIYHICILLCVFFEKI